MQWDVIDFLPSLYTGEHSKVSIPNLHKNIVIVSYFKRLSTEQMIFYHTNGFFPPSGPWKWGHLSFVNLGIKKNALTKK